MDTINLIVPLSSAPIDLVQWAFEWTNKLTDLAIGFYLSNPRSFFAIVLTFIFVIHYLTTVAKRPILFCTEGRFRWFLQANCSVINERYYPTIWCYETHLLTTIANFIRGFLPQLHYHREFVGTPDGGQISLDWYSPECDELICEFKKCSSLMHSNKDKSIALFFPGLTGSSQSEYIKTLIPIAYRVGYKPVVINYRGINNTPLLTPRLYCAANDDDIRVTIEHIRKYYPRAKVVATGISLGGILLSRYLISSGFNSKIDAAFLISVCWDFISGAASMEKGLNFALNQHLTKLLINVIDTNQEMLKKVPGIDFEKIKKCQSLREFDEQFTIKMFNFSSVSHYYTESSHKGKLACVKTPTFCINAADDMFAPTESLPLEEVQQSSHVAMLVTPRGGHIGFMEGLIPCFKGNFFSERLIGQYLSALNRLSNIKCDLM